MAVHQAPTDGRRARGTCTSSSIRRCEPPTKLKYLAGSEQGAGTFISDTLPEESARALRAAIVGCPQ